MFNRILKSINRNKSKYLFLAIVLILLSSLSIVSLNYTKFVREEQDKLLTRNNNSLYIESNLADANIDNDEGARYLKLNDYQAFIDSGDFKDVKLYSNYDIILNNIKAFSNDKYVTRVASLEITNVSPVTNLDADDNFVVISKELAKANDLVVGDSFQIDFNMHNYELVITDIIDLGLGKENKIYTNDTNINNGFFEKAEFTLNDGVDFEETYSKYKDNLNGFSVYLADDKDSGDILIMVNSISERIIMVLIFFSLILVSFVVLFIVKDRRKEIGIYLSLGASKLKIFSTILAEVLIVTLVATSVSLFVTYLLSEYLVYASSRVEIISNAVNTIHNFNAVILGTSVIDYESFIFNPSFLEIVGTYSLVMVIVMISASVSLYSIIKYDERDILHIQ